jgi:hypothetical protein
MSVGELGALQFDVGPRRAVGRHDQRSVSPVSGQIGGGMGAPKQAVDTEFVETAAVGPDRRLVGRVTEQQFSRECFGGDRGPAPVRGGGARGSRGGQNSAGS